MQAGFKKFGTDEQGAVAMTFGLMTMVMLFLCGMAMDYSRAMNVRSRVNDAADSAALVAGRALMEGKLSAGEIQAMAQKYFEQNIKGLGTSAKIDAPSIKIDAVSGAVNVDVSAHVPMTLTRLAGFQTLDFPVSTAAIFKSKDIEVGMALDITGSMKSSPRAGGARKINSLKSAFEKFANKLIPDAGKSEQKIRVAVAPYSSSVNLGTYAKPILGIRNVDNCVTEVADGSATDDVAKYLVKTDGINDIDPTETLVAKAYQCAPSSIVPLSSDRDDLIKTVKRFNADGWTAGHIGTQWAWNLISDKWSWGGGSDAADYGEVENGKLLKAVVLMTDGTFNTAFHGKKSSEQAIALCDAMKEKGVKVFAVAFDATTEAQATLRACSSKGETPDEYYVNAANGSDLEAAFLKFAGQISDLRLAK